LNTAWIIQIFRGIILAVTTLVVAVLIFLAAWTGVAPNESVYADPRLPYVVIVLSFLPLVLGVSSTKLFEATRTLSFSRITAIEIASQATGFLTMLGWALVDRSIWALVAGNICGALLRTFFSHAWLPGTPNRWQWDASARHELIQFGKWVVVSSILGFLAS